MEHEGGGFAVTVAPSTTSLRSGLSRAVYEHLLLPTALAFSSFECELFLVRHQALVAVARRQGHAVGRELSQGGHVIFEPCARELWGALHGGVVDVGQAKARGETLRPRHGIDSNREAGGH